MTRKSAKAGVVPVRQTTQYNCMSASMGMALRACGVAPDECATDIVNKVMGARPMKGAAWEQALACAQHYGVRGTLVCPSTVNQLKEWCDAGKPVMIAWNPEGREWSHASVVFDVTEDPEHGLMVHVADPNIPDPDETVRVVPKGEFYQKWYEKWPNYLVRRPALMLDREITQDGRQVMASAKASRDFRLDRETALAKVRRERLDPDTLRAIKTTIGIQTGVVLPPGESIPNGAHGTFLQRSRSGQVTLRWNPYPGSWGTVLEGVSPFAEEEKMASPDIKKALNWASRYDYSSDKMASRRGPPSQTGSSALLKRQGYTPVDVMFGEALPHRRPIVSNGDGIMDRRGDVYLFAGIEGDGSPILAKDERELERLSDQIIEDRLHVVTASAKRVASAFARKAAQARLDNSLKSKINARMRRLGLDGNGRFPKPDRGFAAAVDAMQEHGVTLDGVVNAFEFSARPSGTVRADIAFIDDSQPFAPGITISNSILYLQYTEVSDNQFEVVAYLS